MKSKIISLILAISILVSVLSVLPVVSATAATVENGTTSELLSDAEKNAKTLTFKDDADGKTSSTPVQIWNRDQLLEFADRVNGTYTVNGLNFDDKDGDRVQDEGEESFKNTYLCAILKADIAFNEGYTYSYDEATLLAEVTDPKGVVSYVGTGLQTSAGTIATWYSDTNRTEGVAEGFVKPESWDPIGKYGIENSYKGSFNGNGHTVSGIFVAQNASYLGFFGFTGSDSKMGVNITGLTVKNSCIIGAGSVGGVVGYTGTNAGDPHDSDSDTKYCDHTDDKCDLGYSLLNDKTANQVSDSINGFGMMDVKISYCNNDNTLVTSTGDCVGGVVGNVYRGKHFFKNDNGVFSAANRNSKNNGNIFHYLENSGTVLSKAQYTAGIIGQGDFGHHQYLYNYGKVENFVTTNPVAGICGGGDRGSLSYCYNYGSVTSNNGNAAGVSLIRNIGASYCFNSGAITSKIGVATGIVITSSDGTSFNYCANAGAVCGKTIAAGIFYGGKASKTYSIQYCYNAGNITTTNADGQKAQLAYLTATVAGGSLNITGSYILNNGVAAEIRKSESTTLTGSATAYEASEIASREFAEKLGTTYYHQTLADDYPIPGAGRISYYIEGDGSAESPFLIHNAKQLKEFAARVNAGFYINKAGETVEDTARMCAKLMADINLNPGYTFDIDFGDAETKAKIKVTYESTEYIYNTADRTWVNSATPLNIEKWTPIGTDSLPYSGNFDGNGHTVSGVYILSPDINYMGFFGYIAEVHTSDDGYTQSRAANITNLTISDSLIVGRRLIGGIAGYALSGFGDANFGSSSNACPDCIAGTCDMTAKGIGKALKKINITNCHTKSSVIASLMPQTSNNDAAANMGGILGYGSFNRHYYKAEANKCYQSMPLVSYCTNSAKIYSIAASNVAGIVGNSNRSDNSNLTNYGDVYSLGAIVAGITAEISDNNKNDMLVNYGNITGTTLVTGGIYGTRAPTNTINYGTITATTGCASGVAIGRDAGNKTVENCANVGAVNAETYASGIALYYRSGGTASNTVKNCYNAGTLTAGKKAAEFNLDVQSTYGVATITNCWTTGSHDFAVNGVSGTVHVKFDEANQIKITEDEDPIADGTLRAKFGDKFGQSVNMYYPVPGFKTSLAGTSVSLTDGILLNFYIEASVHLGVDSAELVKVGDKQYYLVTEEVAAKEMGKDVSVQLKSGETIVGSAYTTSVKAYAEKILAGNYSEKTKELVQAMLNYGAAAKNYFEKVAETPPEDYTALQNAVVADPVVISTPDEEKAGIARSATLVLEGKLTLRIYFYGKDLEVYVGKAKVKATNDTNNLCYVDISITPDNYDTVYNVSSGKSSVSYSLLNYLKNKVNDANSDTNLKNLVASIYAYGVAAKNYVTN